MYKNLLQKLASNDKIPCQLSSSEPMTIEEELESHKQQEEIDIQIDEDSQM